MTKIVHVQTTIQTVFGVLDDEGNVIPQQPVVVNVSLFKPEAFVEAQVAIAGARDQAIANMAPDLPLNTPSDPSMGDVSSTKRRPTARRTRGKE